MAIARRVKPAWNAVAVGLGVSALLWAINLPYRGVFQPTDNDATNLADGLLILPGAHWQDWFTRGYRDFFESYPEWPHQHLTAFARPAFQFLIYLAHFVFGEDWASYLAINYLAIGGVAAVGFAIARNALGLGTAASLFAAMLTSLSPAVLESAIWELGFASESVATFLAGCAFLAVVARRDVLCAILLCVAVLTKETVVWCPFAAALSVLLRPGPGEPIRKRAFTASAMLLPIGIWLGLRLAFFDGLGGTYATTEYTPLSAFLSLSFSKLLRLYHLFVSQYPLSLGDWLEADRILRIFTGLLVFMLLAIWILSRLRETEESIVSVVRARKWPKAEAAALATLWAAAGLGFYFALALHDARYAASAVMFAWPAMVHAALRSRALLPGLVLALCGVASLARVSYMLSDRNPPEPTSSIGQLFRGAAAMNTALRQVPPEITEIYVLPSLSLGWDNPEYIRALLGVRPKIIRLAEMEWNCGDGKGFASLRHEMEDGTVTLAATLPDCAGFFLSVSGIDASALVDGRLSRGPSIVYDMPNARPSESVGPWRPIFEPPQRLTVHIRLQGRARFLIEHGARDGGLAWFDTP